VIWNFKCTNLLAVAVPKILFTCIFAFDTLERNAYSLPFSEFENSVLYSVVDIFYLDGDL
jgi:hypothetical protein